MNHFGKWSDWRKVFLWLPARVNGRWRWLVTVEVSLMPYPNAFAFIGIDFHKRYRMPE